MLSPTGHTTSYRSLLRRAAPVAAAVCAAILLSVCAPAPGRVSADPIRRIVPDGPRPVKNWPVILGNSIRFAPAVADIDGDGRDEIAVCVKDCRVFLLGPNGKTLPGWPVETAATTAQGAVMEDIDGDGEYEIVASTIDGLLHMWREDGSAVEGWPVDLGGSASSPPEIIGSPSTGALSILVAVQPGVVHLLSPDGVDREGWPKVLPYPSITWNIDRHATTTADLDGDGSPEVLHLTSHPAVLFAWHLDGADCHGFPRPAGEGDGIGIAVDDRAAPRRIACVTVEELSLFDLRSGGTTRIRPPGWGEQFIAAPSFVSSGDSAGGNPVLLFTAGNMDSVCLWDLDGRPHAGWPIELDGFIYGIPETEERHEVNGPPIMADVDGDGRQEIILGGYDHHLYCFETDGTPVPGWPVVLEDFIIQGLALAQLDGVGEKELVVGQYGETVFAFHLGPYRPPRAVGGTRRPDPAVQWPSVYYAVSLMILVLMLLLVHLLRVELAGSKPTRGAWIRGALVCLFVVLGVRALFFAGDLYRYRFAMIGLERAESQVDTVLSEELDGSRALADSLCVGLRRCDPLGFTDPLRALRCLERLSDRNRLEYRFSGVLMADRTGRVIQGVGLARGLTDISDLVSPPGALVDPVLIDGVPVYVVESGFPLVAGADTLRFCLVSSMLNRIPNAVVDATGFSAHVRVDGRTMAWGGAGQRPYRSLRPWLGIVQPSREIPLGTSAGPGGPTILLTQEDFERPMMQWLDLAAVLILPCFYLLMVRRRRYEGRVGLRWWWLALFAAVYIAGAVLIHRGRFETGPVPLSGRTLEVLLHMIGVTGFVVVLHRVATSRRSRRLNFTLLGSYLIVSLIPLGVLMIIGGNLLLGVQREFIRRTMGELETRADNMTLAYTGSMNFNGRLNREADDLFNQSTETSWLNFVEENQYLFNYDLPTAYLTLWARDENDPGRYFTGYSYRAPRTGKLYYTPPAWTRGENVKGLFLDNGTAVVIAMRKYWFRGIEMEIVSHMPIDDHILDEMEEELRVLPFLPRIHLEPAWLESTEERARPEGWYLPYGSELVLPARGWQSGTLRWVVYRASMYVPAGVGMLPMIAPALLLIFLPLGLSFWGVWTTYRSTARPLTRLLTGIRRVGEGDLEYRLGEKGTSEVGLAAQAFDSMAASLEKTVAELAEKRKAEEVVELKARFLSMISHDLKTPLSSIQGAAENIIEEVAGPVTGRQRTYLEMILQSSADLQGMITDLLDLSRIEGGRLELDYEPLDMRREVDDLLRSMRPILEEKRLDGRLDVRASRTLVRGDRNRIWQILNNIVSNAVRYSPEGGTIRIMIEDAPVDGAGGRAMLKISVSDEGPGIPEEDASRLFEPFFYRARGISGAHGAGLGLAIVKQLVELHGGSVTLANAPAGGALVSFTLPV